ASTTSGHGRNQRRRAIKMVDIASIGAGGGSMAKVDSLGLLRVGPESAGADPGPACYGQGADATVTDANLILGYGPADYSLGGEMKLNRAASQRAMKPLMQRLGVDEKGAAEAIFRTVNTHIAHSIPTGQTRRDSES